MTLSLKYTVQLAGLRPELVLAAIIVDQVCAELGVDTVITSALDSEHSEHSLHYSGAALDFRTSALLPEAQAELYHQVSTRLGAEFDVVLESDHLHVEYDPLEPEVLTA